jgi:serine protease Do
MIQDVNEDLKKQFGAPNTRGALVSQVIPESSAKKAGIRNGDIIVRYNGKEVEDSRQLRNMVAATLPGTGVKLDVIRNRKEQTVTATIGTATADTAAVEKKSEEAGSNQLRKLGLTVETLTPQLADEYKYQGEKGALITAVEPGSLASLSGLERGDLIVEADRKTVADVGQLEKALASAKDSRTVLLLVKRQGGSLFVVLQTASN